MSVVRSRPPWREGERTESKIVNGQTGDYSNVIVAEEENNHWLPPTYSAR